MRAPAAILIGVAATCLAADGVITSIAGVGPTQTDLVEGRRATDAVLGEVHALAFGSNGDLLIGAQRLVVRIDSTGVAHSVAGVGTFGSDGVAGDNVRSRNVPIGILRGLACASDDSIYFSDVQTVRRIWPDGLVTTVLPFSAGYLSPRALALDPAGSLYVAVLGRRNDETLRGVIVEISAEGRIAPLDLRDPAGAAVVLNQPEGLTLDSTGALYVTEYAGHRVRKIVNGIATIVAGSSSGGFSGDGGLATQAELRGPSGVAVARDGTMFIADTLNSRIRVVAPNGVINTLRWTGPGGETSSTLSAPAHVLIHPSAQALYVAEYSARRVVKIDSGIIATVAGSGAGMTWSADTGDGGPALLARLSAPEGIAACGGGLYVADTNNASIRKITPDGGIHTVAGPETSLTLPTAVACDGRGAIYIADRGRPRILKVGPDGSISTLLGDGSFNHPGVRDPRGVAADGQGNVFITERFHSRVLKIAEDGVLTVLWSGRPGFDFPHAIALDAQGRPYVSVNSSSAAATVLRVEAGGALTHIAGAGRRCAADTPEWHGLPAKNADLCFVGALAIDTAGRLYLAADDRLARIEPDGALHWIAGANLSTPEGVPPLGDGGRPRAANLNGVSSIAAGPAGIYFTQLIHNRVRRLAFHR